MVLMEVQFWHEELDTTLQGMIVSWLFLYVLVTIQPDFAPASFMLHLRKVCIRYRPLWF